MAGFNVDDVRGILVATVKLELIDAEALCLSLGPDESAVEGVHFLQPLQVNRFDRVLAKASNLSDLLEVIGSDGKKISGVLQEWLRNPMSLRLKRHLLNSGDLAGWAQELFLVELQGSISGPKFRCQRLQGIVLLICMKSPQLGQARSASSTLRFPWN
ncbi:hypothetical protein [Proteiniclasticum sp. QWL-01]|uniref:hypothetical protein n=1 Tax=Proteiniclasticum sp. QWL-01 TaxID=3036945 RepID=UPI00240EB6F0|nr:hypothetical protein [Proteiniclasticum sp. QWL-01]WFF72785.1 hypothetical protein P6M73_16185 [Proteiniclasticum sp. QWL-01]